MCVCVFVKIGAVLECVLGSLEGECLEGKRAREIVSDAALQSCARSARSACTGVWTSPWCIAVLDGSSIIDLIATTMCSASMPRGWRVFVSRVNVRKKRKDDDKDDALQNSRAWW